TQREEHITLSLPMKRMLMLGLLVAVVVVAFMTVGSRGNWDFVLPFRGTKIAAMALVAYAIAVSTVLFQTITSNRILTPSIMGFAALYTLIQTALVFVLGSQQVSNLHPYVRFGMEVLLMMGFTAVLYRWLFGGERRSLHLLVLVG